MRTLEDLTKDVETALREICKRGAYPIIDRINEKMTSGWVLALPPTHAHHVMHVLFKREDVAHVHFDATGDSTDFQMGKITTTTQDPATSEKIITFIGTALNKALELDSDLRAATQVAFEAAKPFLLNIGGQNQKDPENSFLTFSDIKSEGRTYEHFGDLAVAIRQCVNGQFTKSFIEVEFFLALPDQPPQDAMVVIGAGRLDSDFVVTWDEGLMDVALMEKILAAAANQHQQRIDAAKAKEIEDRNKALSAAVDLGLGF